MFVLQFADDNSTPDYVFSVYETDTSVTTTGSAAASGDVIVHGHSAAGVAVDTKIASGVLTMTANGDEDNTYTFEYIGAMRWVRLYASVGTKTNTISCQVIKHNCRRQPKIA